MDPGEIHFDGAPSFRRGAPPGIRAQRSLEIDNARKRILLGGKKVDDVRLVAGQALRATDGDAEGEEGGRNEEREPRQGRSGRKAAASDPENACRNADYRDRCAARR